jgi:gas vesicle protein
MAKAREKEEFTMDDNSKLSYFLFGFGFGLAVGILFAPQSGEKTREYLKSKADEGKEFVRRRSEELKDSASELIDRGRTAVSRQKEQLAAAIEAGKQAYREAVAKPEASEGVSNS